MTKKVDIKEFAERVERLCEFLLAKMEKDGSDDVVTLQDLQDEAADIQSNNTNVVSESIAGLSEYMKGVNKP
jgi:phosphopantetheine adenylyltransferase